MKVKTLLIAILSLSILLGCSSPKIDTSSDETMKASIEKVRQSLPKEKKEQFDEALKILAFNQIDFKNILSAAAGFGTTEAKIKEVLNGKTGNEVIAEAEKIKKERKEKERIQALEEIKELKDKKVKANQARTELSNFKVLRSRFYKRSHEYSFMPEPIIELTVKNGTRHAVSRAYFIGTIASPNRSVPWLKDSFNYEISGGLEPGEEATWHLAPNSFSEWGKVDVPKDAIFTVQVEQIDGSDGKALYSTKIFSEEDEKRLKTLKESYK